MHWRSDFGYNYSVLIPNTYHDTVEFDVISAITSQWIFGSETIYTSCKCQRHDIAIDLARELEMGRQLARSIVIMVPLSLTTHINHIRTKKLLIDYESVNLTSYLILSNGQSVTNWGGVGGGGVLRAVALCQCWRHSLQLLLSFHQSVTSWVVCCFCLFVRVCVSVCLSVSVSVCLSLRAVDLCNCWRHSL